MNKSPHDILTEGPEDWEYYNDEGYWTYSNGKYWRWLGTDGNVYEEAYPTELLITREWIGELAANTPKPIYDGRCYSVVELEDGGWELHRHYLETDICIAEGRTHRGVDFKHVIKSFAEKTLLDLHHPLTADRYQVDDSGCYDCGTEFIVGDSWAGFSDDDGEALCSCWDERAAKAIAFALNDALAKSGFLS